MILFWTLLLLSMAITLAFSPITQSILTTTRQRQLSHPRLATTPDGTSTVLTPWAMDQLDDYADSVGVVLTWSTLGPGYRAVARAAHNESLILGYVEGFIRPAGQILHLDKMEIFQPQLQKARSEAPGCFDFGGVGIGLGVLMGYRCLWHGQQQGCSIAEFLAIDDEAFQHKRLVRYYQQAGFQIVKYVGDDFRDIPDRMVWGGCGTLMREDINLLTTKWTRLLSLMKKRADRRKV
ncbi:hypothetical protein IV203_001431 [Nitzschia inconspicua]|uniref:N-acetyltransferase domain-containing protein n=1 Tax=Nitzschia inconspicua TaxID=303405 RepID=A0A9K3L8C4_9STRA|nr:hypothetical protein IV203_001431 [Nitzschia inconspicua]